MSTSSKYEQMAMLAGIGLVQVLGRGVDNKISPITPIDETTGRRVDYEKEMKAARARAEKAAAVAPPPPTSTSPSRIALTNALHDLFLLEERNIAINPKEYQRRRQAVAEAIDRLNYGRQQNKLPKMSTKDFLALSHEIRMEVVKELEGESCEEYTKNFDTHKPFFYDDVPEEEPMERSPVDYKWSEKAVLAIFKIMDPDGVGYATQGMRFNGIYTDKRGKVYPLRHSSVKQSLKWLWGGKSRLGFLSHPGLSREDRIVLMDFANKSSLEVYGRYYNNSHFDS